MFPLISVFSEWALLILRVILGAVLIVHGIPKFKDRRGTAAWFGSAGFRPGILWSSVVMLVEILGGLALILGFLTQAVSVLVLIEFLVILIWKLKSKQPFVGNVELDLIILGAALILAAFGPGVYSLDQSFFLGV